MVHTYEDVYFSRVFQGYCSSIFQGFPGHKWIILLCWRPHQHPPITICVCKIMVLSDAFWKRPAKSVIICKRPHLEQPEGPYLWLSTRHTEGPAANVQWIHTCRVAYWPWEVDRSDLFLNSALMIHVITFMTQVREELVSDWLLYWGHSIQIRQIRGIGVIIFKWGTYTKAQFWLVENNY